MGYARSNAGEGAYLSWLPGPHRAWVGRQATPLSRLVSMRALYGERRKQ